MRGVEGFSPELRAFGPSVGFVGPDARFGRYDSRPRLVARPIRITRSSTRNAPRCASPMKAVPQALSGYRPKVAVTASAGYQYTDTNTTSGGTPTQIVRTEIHGTNAPPQCRRHRHAERVQRSTDRQQDPRRREPGFRGAREGLRVLEQSVLLSAATIYMDYLRDFRDRRGPEEQRSRARTDA